MYTAAAARLCWAIATVAALARWDGSFIAWVHLGKHDAPHLQATHESMQCTTPVMPRLQWMHLPSRGKRSSHTRFVARHRCI